MPTRYLLPLIAAVGLTAAVGAVPEALAAPQKLPSPTGKITYTLTTPFGTGKQTLTWADGGKRMRQDSSMAAGKQPVTSWVITDGSYVYSFTSFGPKQVSRMKLPPNVAGSGNAGLTMIGSASNMGKVVGKGTVAGKPCEIREVDSPVGGMKGMKVWMWQNLPLKMEMPSQQGVGISMVATKVEANAKVAASTFKLPAGLPVKDVQTPKPGSRPPVKK